MKREYERGKIDGWGGWTAGPLEGLGGKKKMRKLGLGRKKMKNKRLRVFYENDTILGGGM